MVYIFCVFLDVALDSNTSIKLTQDANEDKPGKYSAKPGLEPELSRPKQNHYIYPLGFCEFNAKQCANYYVFLKLSR